MRKLRLRVAKGVGPGDKLEKQKTAGWEDARRGYEASLLERRKKQVQPSPAEGETEAGGVGPLALVSREEWKG